jgi:hypothetical protein
MARVVFREETDDPGHPEVKIIRSAKGREPVTFGRPAIRNHVAELPIGTIATIPFAIFPKFRYVVPGLVG